MMIQLFWILEGKTPVPCPDVLAWAQWMEDPSNRKVAFTDVRGLEVSTVFLGIDSGFRLNRRNKAPILFETMVFNQTGALLNVQRRYSTWDEAETGHNAIVQALAIQLPK